MKKNILFNVIRQNETVDGFLDLTGYISEADKVMEYMDYQKEKISREVIPLEELEKVVPQATGLIMTDMHPWEFLNSVNAQDYIKGFVTKNYGIEDKKLKVDVRVINSSTIKEIKLGRKEQFSIGYYCDILEEAGVTDDGEAYDVKQIDLKLNHFSLVPTGRAGEKIGVIKLNSKDDNISYQKGMYHKENGGEEMAIKYNGKEMESAELHAELLVRDKELAIKTNEVDSLSGEITALKATNEELTQKINGMSQTLNSEFTERINKAIEVSEMTGEDIKELVKLNSDDLKKKVINSAFPNIDLTDKSAAFIDGLYQGAIAKMNTADKPKVTPSNVKDKEVKTNGISRLEMAINNIGGKN